MKRPPDAGLLVVFEGIDGAGKSTQIRGLAARLAADQVPHVMSREPTDGPHGRRLRASATLGRLPPELELVTFLADRQEHVDALILPALAAGKVVVLDRYYFSTAAYQGARGFDWRDILRRNEAFAPEPDVVFWFDLSPEASQQRIGGRGEAVTAFEQLESLRQVADIYAAIAKTRPFVHRLDATRPAADLIEEIWELVIRRRWERRTPTNAATTVPSLSNPRIAG